MSSEKKRSYSIKLSSSAARYLTHLDKSTATRILDRLESLKTNPFHYVGVKPLTGQLSGLYRLRIGGYRAVYKISEEDRVVIVLVIGPRGDVYK